MYLIWKYAQDRRQNPIPIIELVPNPLLPPTKGSFLPPTSSQKTIYNQLGEYTFSSWPRVLLSYFMFHSSSQWPGPSTFSKSPEVCKIHSVRTWEKLPITFAPRPPKAGYIPNPSSGYPCPGWYLPDGPLVLQISPGVYPCIKTKDRYWAGKLKPQWITKSSAETSSVSSSLQMVTVEKS